MKEVEKKDAPEVSGGGSPPYVTDPPLVDYPPEPFTAPEPPRNDDDPSIWQN